MNSDMSRSTLSILTINIGAASRERAGILLKWLSERPEDVFILTETSNGSGTAWLMERFRQAGFAVLHTPDSSGDRGVALISRVRIVKQLAEFATVTIPGRLVAAALDTEPPVAALGVYVPSRDRTEEKIKKKRDFLASLIQAVHASPEGLRGQLIMGGDYNVIGPAHQPLHKGFFPFEFAFFDGLDKCALSDAHERCAPGVQVHSWVGRTGEGYRYDYFHVGRHLADRISGCAYLPETREARLTDHAAVTLHVAVDSITRLTTSDPAKDSAQTLF